MNVQDIQIGDYLQNTNGNIGKVIGILPYNQSPPDVVMNYNGGTCFSDPKILQPISITPELLKRNGWKYFQGIYVLKSTPRLGWYPKAKQLIIGYAMVDITIEYVHELQHLLRICKLDDIKL